MVHLWLCELWLGWVGKERGVCLVMWVSAVVARRRHAVIAESEEERVVVAAGDHLRDKLINLAQFIADVMSHRPKSVPTVVHTEHVTN